MYEINKLFNGIYGNLKNAIIIYDMNGNVIWHNQSLGNFMKDDQLFEEIYTEIIRQCTESGDIKYGNGGRFYKAFIQNIDCFIAEIYAKNRLLNFFSDKDISKFTQNSDSLVRQAVTKISASCSLLNDYVDANNDESKYCLNTITSSCFRLMRNISLNSLLANIADERNINSILLSVDHFLLEITKECQKILGEKYRVIYSGKTSCNIYADKTLITYFILSLIRQLICTGGKSEFNIIITAEKIDSHIKVSFEKIYISKFDTNKKDVYAYNSELNTDEISRIFAEKLNAQYCFKDNILNILFKCAENNGKILLEFPKITLDDSMFSPYRIMLNDITDYMDFY